MPPFLLKSRRLRVTSAVVCAGLLTSAHATGDSATPPAAPALETNGPLAYQTGTTVTLTTVGTSELVTRQLLTGDAVDDDGEVTQFPIENAADPAWSPSGLRLAFTRKVDGRRQIFLTNRGAEPRQLLQDPAEAFDPAWSNTGERLAFTSTRNGHPEVWVVDVSGEHPARLTPLTPGRVARDPDWSPSGDRIAFVSNQAGTVDIWTMAPNGSALQQVTAMAGAEVDPDWRPDGTQIAFAGTRRGRSSIFVVDREGATVPRALTRARAPLRDRFPSWAPAGDAIAFTRIGTQARTQTRVTNTSNDTWHTSRQEIIGGGRASWGALPAPPKNPAMLEGSVIIMPGDDTTVSPPASSVRDAIADDGARVPEGYVVRASESDPVTLVANPASTDSPPGTSVEVEVSGTFEVTEDGSDLALELVGSPLDCSAGETPIEGGATALAAAPKKSKKLKQKGKGTGHGPRGVSGDKKGVPQGTDWSIEETCAGTIFAVEKGSVLVEFGAGFTELVTAGETFPVPRG